MHHPILNSVRLALAACTAALVLGAGAAYAETSAAFSLTGATDYIWRGVSQTDQNPAIFAAAEFGWDGFYAGAGAENVDFGNSVDTEYDLWAGWRGDLAGFGLDLGLVRYGYLNAPSGADLDTLEAKFAVSHPIGPATLSAAVFYTDDYFAVEDSGLYTELNLSAPIADAWTVSGAIGHQEISGSNADYTTWNAGITYAVAEHVTLDLRYHDTDAHEAGDVFDAGVVASFRIAL